MQRTPSILTCAISDENGDRLDVYGKITRQIAMVLFFLGIIRMLIPGRESGPPPMRSMQEISITGHMLVFFLGAYLLYAFRPSISARPFYQQVLLLLGAALVVSITTEGLQHYIPGRTVSHRDAIVNITGAMLFLSIKNLNLKRLALFHTAVAVITIGLLWPFFRAVSDEITAYRQFPLLAGFETPFEANRFIRGTGKFNVSDEYAYTGSKSLRVRFGTQTYSGIAMEYMPKNWQGYSQLHFAVYNPQEKEVTLHTRIHDAHHGKSGPMIYADRFNRSFSIPPEAWTTITFPLKSVKNAPRTREMDMSQISNIGFFVAREPDTLWLYIDDIRLSKASQNLSREDRYQCCLINF